MFARKCEGERRHYGGKEGRLASGFHLGQFDADRLGMPQIRPRPPLKVCPVPTPLRVSGVLTTVGASPTRNSPQRWQE